MQNPDRQDWVNGCAHREDYSIKFGVDLDLHTETPKGPVYDGPRYRTGPGGDVIFALERHEQGFQAWYLAEHGAAHSGLCQKLG
jgi:hypothetical protein